MAGENWGKAQVDESEVSLRMWLANLFPVLTLLSESNQSRRTAKLGVCHNTVWLYTEFLKALLEGLAVFVRNSLLRNRIVRTSPVHAATSLVLHENNSSGVVPNYN